MENSIVVFSEERIQEARKCLEENNSEMEHMVDRIDYYTARLEILISRLHISRSDAKILLAKINTKPSVEDIMECTKNIISTTIQEVSYDDLIKEFSEAYDTFCRDREINPSFPPIEWADEIIYWFKKPDGEQHTISLWLAYELLYDGIQSALCHNYLESIYHRSPTYFVR